MKKEDFFEVLGELDDDFVKGAKVMTMKKKMTWKTIGAMAACLALVAALGVGMLNNSMVAPIAPNENISANEESTISMKPVINFEGVVTAVENQRITLDSGKVIIITEETAFGGDLDTNNAVSTEILVGNYIQGYTADNAEGAELTANNIWTNVASEK